jgi:hypothetical protein
MRENLLVALNWRSPAPGRVRLRSPLSGTFGNSYVRGLGAGGSWLVVRRFLGRVAASSSASGSFKDRGDPCEIYLAPDHLIRQVDG